MSASERARFRRHLCTLWDVHRHRMAPQIGERIAATQASGQLQVHAGRLLGLGVACGNTRISFHRREGGELHTLQAARVINCAGSCSDVARSPDPLMQALLATGTVRPDPLSLGLDVTGEGAVIGRSGMPSRRLFAIGPPTRGVAWEITAVPDIRRECRDMARVLGELLVADTTATRLPWLRPGSEGKALTLGRL